MMLSYGSFESDLEEFLGFDGKFHREFVHDLLGVAIDDEAYGFLHGDSALLAIEELFLIDFGGGRFILCH